MSLTIAVIAGFLLTAWMLYVLIAAVRASAEVTAAAARLNRDGAYDIVEALEAVSEVLRAPKCEMAGCSAFAAYSITEFAIGSP